MRGKKSQPIESVEIQPVQEPTHTNGNGEDDPVEVVFSDSSMFYDPKTKKYFMFAKVGLKKLVLEEKERK